MAERNERVEAALAYAAKGLAVIPVFGIKNGKCACGNPDCEHPGKHPMTGNGVKSATTDEQKIRYWFEKCPGANIGIATGRISGIWVLDIDGLKGYQSYDRLTDRLDDPGDSWIAETGGGGAHRYYRYPENVECVRSKTALVENIDIRGDGGYVIAPPSDHISGNPYTWAVDPEMNELDYCVEAWDRAFRKAGVFEQSSAAGPEPEEGEKVDRIPRGMRNDTLFKMATGLRSKGYTGTEIQACLSAANRLRCDPPISEREVAHIAQSAVKYDRGKGVADGIKEDPKTYKLSDIDLNSMEGPSWIWENRLSTGLALLAGAPKIGKSWMALDLALHVAEGREYLGSGTEKGDVLYLALEDTERRVALRSRELLGDKPYPEGFHFMVEATAITQGLPEMLERKIAEMNGPKLVIIDTLGKVRGDMSRAENAYQYDTREMTLLKQVADRHNMCIMLIHHKRKDTGKSDDIFEMISGTSGIFGAMDTAMLLDGIRKDADFKKASLKITGRDIETDTLPLAFEKGRWEIDEAREDDEREEEFYSNPVIKAIELWKDTETSINWQGSPMELAEKLQAYGCKLNNPSVIGKIIKKYGNMLEDEMGLLTENRHLNAGRVWFIKCKAEGEFLGINRDEAEFPEGWLTIMER